MGKIKNLLFGAKKIVTSHKKLSLILLIIIIAAGYLVFPKGSKQILTASVTKQDIVKTVSVTGNVDAQNSVNLTFQTAETLSYVGVKLNDAVKKGQIIASLDQTQLQATLRQAQQDFIAAKAASQQYYDNHTNATESDEEKVQRTAIDDTQNKAYDQMLKVEHDISNSTLYSPIAGIVTRMDAQTAGVNITPLTTFTITDPSSLDFKMEVDEADIGQVKVGQKVQVSLDAFPNNILNLIVDKIDFVSHVSSSGGNSFYVYAYFPKNTNYRDGMSGNADIIINSKNNVLSIPSSSIFDDNYVYAKVNNKFQKKRIQPGIQSDTDVEVLSGLSEGDTVAVDPTSVTPNMIAK